MNHPNRPERAVMVGASMAGLLAAAALVPPDRAVASLRSIRSHRSTLSQLWLS